MKSFFRYAFLMVIAAVAVTFCFDIGGFQTIICDLLNIAPAAGGVAFAMAGLVAPFPVDPELTSIAVAYKNPKLIADDVLPRVPVGLKNFKYRVHSKAESFTIPETIVGRTSQPNQVEMSFTEEDSSTHDDALDQPVPMDDIDNAPKGWDPLARATEQITNLILLKREQRAAALVFGAGSYAAANKSTLVGAAQWSHADSSPVVAIMTALDSCVMRPNIAVFGRATWSALRQHADVVKATNRNSGDSGIAAQQAVAELLELDAIYVGDGWYNTAKPGQAVSLSRLWGKHAGFLYRDAMAGPTGGVTFGFTAQFGDRVAGRWEDKNIGMRGGIMVRAGESVKELATANDLGYLFTNAVA